MQTKRRLLLADDSPTIQKVVSLTFADEGMDVETAGSGAAALAALAETLPDVVLADVHMPAPGGLQLCEHIRRDERTRHIPVLLLVGMFEPFNEAEARRVGADDVLTKPFQSIRELVNKVGGMLGGRRHGDERPLSVTGPVEERPAAATRDVAPPAWGQPAAVSTEERPISQAPPPAAPFADFGRDDAGIESLSAEEFDARRREPTAEFSEEEPTFNTLQEDQPVVMLKESPPPADAPLAAPASSFEPAPLTHVASARAASGYEAAPPGFVTAPGGAPSSFAAHAASAAAADDALLDLGDIEPPHTPSAAPAEADDFILDIGDDEPQMTAPSARASYDGGAVEEQAQRAAAPAVTEPHVQVEEAEAETLAPVMGTPAAQESVQEETAQPFATRQPVEFEPNVASAAATQVTDDRAAEAFSLAGAEPAGPPAVQEVPEPQASEAPAVAAAQQFDAGQLSPEVIEAIARRVAEHLSARAVQDVAWEVVPELAERLIRQRMDEMDRLRAQ